jgi:hypothetical protein
VLVVLVRASFRSADFDGVSEVFGAGAELFAAAVLAAAVVVFAAAPMGRLCIAIKRHDPCREHTQAVGVTVGYGYGANLGGGHGGLGGLSRFTHRGWCTLSVRQRPLPLLFLS